MADDEVIGVGTLDDQAAGIVVEVIFQGVELVGIHEETVVVASLKEGAFADVEESRPRAALLSSAEGSGGKARRRKRQRLESRCLRCVVNPGIEPGSPP